MMGRTANARCMDCSLSVKKNAFSGEPKATGRLRLPAKRKCDVVVHVLRGSRGRDGQLLAVGRFAAQDLDVARGQLAGPLHRRRDMALLVGLRPLPGDEVEAELLIPLLNGGNLIADGGQPLLAAALDATRRAARRCL